MKQHRKSIILLSLMFAITLVFAFPVSAAAPNYDAVIYEQDNPQGNWYVGSNVQVTKRTGSGFEIKSKDGTPFNSNVVWAFPVSQLEQTPYFNIVINNDQPEGSAPYMRMYFTADNYTAELEPFKSELEGWVITSSMRGTHSLDLGGTLDKMFKALKHTPGEDSFVYVFMWVDNMSNEAPDPLSVEALYLSAEQIEAPATPTPPPATATPEPTAVPSAPSASEAVSETSESISSDISEEISEDGNPSDGSEAESDIAGSEAGSSDTNSDPKSSGTWIYFAIGSGVVAAALIIGVFVIKNKKKKANDTVK